MGAGGWVALVIFSIAGIVTLIGYTGYLADEVYDKGDTDRHRYRPEYDNDFGGLHAWVYDLGYTAEDRRVVRKERNRLKSNAAKLKNTERFNAKAGTK